MKPKTRGYHYYLRQCKKLGIAIDLFDYEHEIDSSLTYWEIQEELESKLFSKYGEPDKEQLFSDMQRVKRQKNQLNFTDLHTKKVILVFGETRSGKTALSFNILEQIRKKKRVFVYKHPLPEAIKLLNFENMFNVSELGNIKNCAVYIDEPQLTFPRGDKKTNTFLTQLYTLAGQRKITVILSTSDSRWVNKGTEAFVNSWFIKDCEPELLKNGSRIKGIIKNYSTFGLVDFKLSKEEYIYYDRNEAELTGKYIFNLPPFWNDILSTPFG